MRHVLVIPGDGIGPEVVRPTVDVLSSLTDEIDFDFADAGKISFERTGESISTKTLEMAQEADAILFGATTSVHDPKYVSPILLLRQQLDLFANVRPVKALLPGSGNIDLVIVRENTEGLYTQREEQDALGVTTLRRVTAKASERVVKFAYAWADEHKRRRISCIHKANVLRLSDGLFLEIFRNEADSHPDIESYDMLVDSAAMRLVMKPEEFDMIVTLNLYGDILSDLAAGLIGGLGFVPSANIGERNALFEPVHGSAPDIAGKGVANPLASLLSGAMMLDYLGFISEGDLLRSSIDRMIGEIGQDIVDGSPATSQIIERLDSLLRQ